MKTLLSLATSALIAGCAHIGLFSPSFDFQEGHIFQYQTRSQHGSLNPEITVWASPFNLSDTQLERELNRFAAQEAQARGCLSHQLDAITFGQYNTLINGRRYARATLLCSQVTVTHTNEPSTPFVQPSPPPSPTLLPEPQSSSVLPDEPATTVVVLPESAPPTDTTTAIPTQKSQLTPKNRQRSKIKAKRAACSTNCQKTHKKQTSSPSTPSASSAKKK